MVFGALQRTPPRSAHGSSTQATGPFWSRRAFQVYVFLFVNTLIFVMRGQWMVSLPDPIETGVLSRHEEHPTRAVKSPEDMERSLKELGSKYDDASKNSTLLRIQDKIRKGGDKKAFPDSKEVKQVVVTPEGNDVLPEAFLPKSQDVIEAIYARGKQRIHEELARRGNKSEIEPFNPWGPVYIWDWFSPDYNCPTMERIGRVGDGGKWICGVDVLRSRKCLVYSYGVNRDLSFELELIERTGCQVHAFDPTVGGTPPDCKGNPHITFHKQALGPKSGPSDVFMLVESLLDTMKKEGHTFIDVLKVDIEGSEWETFKSLLPEMSLPFGQLLIELHFQDTLEVFNFFENMDNHGYRIFMRETNHNPCAAGKKPVAVEFSLINPQLYFSGKPDKSSAIAIQSRPEPVKYNGVIYVLSKRSNKDRLSQMLANLDRNYNQRFKYPVIIFHEDFTQEDMRSLQEDVYSRLEFREVSFQVPEWLDKDKIPERTPCSFHSSTVGYRHMNRFLAYFASVELAKEYEWQWRLDDDSLISEEVGYDLFDLMAQNHKKYGFTNIVQDDDKCVLGLWDAAKDYVDEHKLDNTTFFSRWKEGAVFYNNFEISHSSVWTSDSYRQYFEHIDRLGGIYYHRWGDAPIRSIGVSMFVDEKEVHQFTDVAYTHLPFIARNASGLPSPQQTLYPRGGAGDLVVGGGVNCTGVSGGHGAGAAHNGSCMVGRPSGIIYTVLNDDSESVDKLKKTLASLDEHFNTRYHYPVAVFGYKLDVKTRKELRRASKSMLEFHELDFLTDMPLPTHVDRKRVPKTVDCAFGDDTVGDRHRNRHLASTAVDMLSDKYDWMWRLAPEGLLTENVTYDPFAMLATSGKRYGYLGSMLDDSRCVHGLWEATKAYVSVKDIEPTFFKVLPENSAFYNGFEISHRSLWQSPEYREYFEYLDRQGGMFYYRWNEANIHTLALSLFTPADEIHRFSDIGFEHWPFIKQQTNRAIKKKPVVQTLQQGGQQAALKVAAAPDLDRLFAARRLGFLGADVATSFRLPSVARYGDYVWLMGDTFLGTSNGIRRDGGSADMVHNTLAFTPTGHDLTAADVIFFWRTDVEGHPDEVFQLEGPENEHVMLWPVSGLSVEYDGKAKIVLLASRVLKTHDVLEVLVGEGVNFEVQGTSVIIIDNPEVAPSRWTYRVANLPNTDQTHNWHTGVALANGKEVATSADDMVYILGNVGTRGIGVFDTESKTVLARMNVKDLIDLKFTDGGMQVLINKATTTGGTEWMAREAAPAESRVGIFQPASPEMTLQYISDLGLWVAPEVDTVTAQLVLWTAKDVQGPWESSVVYSIAAPFDDLDQFRCYAGKGHPELARPLEGGAGMELVFSYVCNSATDSRLLFEEEYLAGLYTPTFVRATVAPLAGATEKKA